jgi:hypothetical protein
MAVTTVDWETAKAARALGKIRAVSREAYEAALRDDATLRADAQTLQARALITAELLSAGVFPPEIVAKFRTALRHLDTERATEWKATDEL